MVAWHDEIDLTPILSRVTPNKNTRQNPAPTLGPHAAREHTADVRAVISRYNLAARATYTTLVSQLLLLLQSLLFILDEAFVPSPL